MKTLKSAVISVFAIFVLGGSARAQTLLDQIETSAQEVELLTWYVNSTLNSIPPNGSIDALSYAQLQSIVSNIGTKIVTLDARLAAIGDPDFETFRTPMAVAYNELSASLTALGSLVGSSNSSGVMAAVSGMHGGNDDLMLIAGGIRGEVQKSKGAGHR